jgi:hypothetical protein
MISRVMANEMERDEYLNGRGGQGAGGGGWWGMNKLLYIFYISIIYYTLK